MAETMVVLTEPGRVAAELRWAQRVGAACGSDRLVVVCCRIDAEAEPLHPVDPGGAEHWDFGLAGEAIEAAESLDGVATDVLFMRDPEPADTIIREIRRRDIHSLVIAADGLWPAEAPQSQLVGKLLRTAPCRAVLLDPNGTDGRSCKSVAASMGRPGAGGALQLAAAVAGAAATVVPVLAVAEFSEDAAEVGRRELAMFLRDAGIDESTPGVEPKVALADAYPEGLLQGAAGCDLVVIGGGGGRILRELRTTERAFHPAGAAPAPAIAVCRPAPRQYRRLRHLRAAVKAWLPELALADRIELFERVGGGARWNADFAIMIGLATVIASLGLKIDSIPVIIGAMLVAPLMTPLIGAGLALAQGNVGLFRRSITATILGLITGLTLSTLVGLVTLKGDLPLEVAVRGQPHLLDLLIALASGIAAAYAFSRATVAEAVAGVAIAAALVPPLAAVGIALSYGRIIVAEGAAILLVTNLAAIILGAAFTFSVLGARGTRIRAKPTTWVRRVVLALVVLVVLLLLPLGVGLADKMAAGQVRPMAFPLSKRVRDAIQARVDIAPGVDIVMMGRSGVTEINTIAILLSADRPVAGTLTDDLRDIVSGIRGRGTTARIMVLQKAEIHDDRPEDPPTKNASTPASGKNRLMAD